MDATDPTTKGSDSSKKVSTVNETSEMPSGSANSTARYYLIPCSRPPRKFNKRHDLCDTEFNEYVEMHAGEDYKTPVLMANSVLLEIFGENWEEFLKSKGAIVEDHKDLPACQGGWTERNKM